MKWYVKLFNSQNILLKGGEAIKKKKKPQASATKSLMCFDVKRNLENVTVGGGRGLRCSVEINIDSPLLALAWLRWWTTKSWLATLWQVYPSRPQGAAGTSSSEPANCWSLWRVSSRACTPFPKATSPTFATPRWKSWAAVTEYSLSLWRSSRTMSSKSPTGKLCPPSSCETPSTLALSPWCTWMA